MNAFEYITTEFNTLSKDVLWQWFLKARDAYTTLKWQFDIMSRDYRDLLDQNAEMRDENYRLKKEIEMMQSNIISMVDRELYTMKRRVAQINRPRAEELYY
jgi:hypothetical protein